ncbi:transcriptional corepressor LEUNIG-like [Citrus sinensis]|uniref:Transcriptional corepressor LEUNIG-like n=1 Tax=Citrus sinensis TaxID=2711 RepID=A0ACB8NHI8_CITSI|nr:transcriptional corepressor LEUNIG-like [Citrus sinensis]
MASNSGFDAQRMLELYLHDYFVKHNMHETAETFRKEVNVEASHSVAIDVPDGFLHEWWCIFYDFAAQLKHRESNTETSSEVTYMTENQPLHPMVPQLALDQQRPRQFPRSADFDSMIGEPSLLAAKFQEEEQFRRSIHLQQQIHSQSQLVRDNLRGFDFGRTTLMDPALYGAQSPVPAAPGLHGAGLNGDVNPMPSNIWPLDAPKNQRQFQTSTMNHQQQILAPTQSLTLGNLKPSFPGSSAGFARHKLMVPKMDLRGKNAQMAVPMRQTAQHQLHGKQPQHQQLEEDDRKAEGSKPVNENIESVSSHDTTVDSSTAASNKNKPRGSSFSKVNFNVDIASLYAVFLSGGN